MNQPSAPAVHSPFYFILRPLVILLRFLSRLFKSIWIFFPGTIFLILALWCFWSLSQGKDLIYAFAENSKARPYFFIAVGFWVYVSWFSSRVISYLLIYKQNGKAAAFEAGADASKPNATFNNTDYFHIPVTWLNIFPRLIGFSCLLVIELAVLQLSLFDAPAISSRTAGTVFLISLLIYIVSYKYIEAVFTRWRHVTKIVFYSLLGLFLLLATLISIASSRSLMHLFWVLLVMHILYIVYIHLRRTEKENIAIEKEQQTADPFKRRLYRFMEVMHVPRKELGYFIWFNIIAIVGLIVYLLAIFKMDVAWNIGPFPFVLLAFAVLGGFGNIITALSVRANVNFHLIIFLLAFFIPSGETHKIRTFKKEAGEFKDAFKTRQNINEYYRNWVTARGKEIDSAANGYNVYFVLANGGASRSGYWTASVLGKLEDATKHTREKFSRHLFCLSGASGGSVGNATFFSLLNEKKTNTDSTISMERSATAYLKNDFLTYTLARMLGPDYFKFISHTNFMTDRAGALEQVVESSVDKCNEPLKPAFHKNFSSLLVTKSSIDPLPILCINVTRMQDGNPGVVSNILIDRKNFNNRVDVLGLLPDSLDMHLSTAVIMGARFPYISPAGRIDEMINKQGSKKKDSIRAHYFVDGGYFDNSGAGVVQEMIRAMKIQADSSKDMTFRERVAKLKFMILHITNSPTGTAWLEPVAPIKNDLSAPMLTMVGAYDKQTTVNDKRLENFLKDLEPGKGIYYPIHLYRNANETLPEKEEPYAMNWFISDTTLKRMDKRLNTQPQLQSLIAGLLNASKLK
jgi:predicted acylesterase/phospholipase RssA